MGILIFFGILCFLIILHEFGHFIAARLNGVRVEKFAVGFGPQIVNRKVKHTDFSVRVIPLGGYVKLAGDEADNCQGLKDEYLAKAPGLRARIVFAGPLFNYILALVFFILMFFSGFQVLVPRIGEIQDDSPARVAGLQKEDLILTIDGAEIKEWKDVQKMVFNSKGRELVFTVKRQDEVFEVPITPQKKSYVNILGVSKDMYMIGILPTGEATFMRYPLWESVREAFGSLWFFTRITYQALWYMVTGTLPVRESMTGPLGIYFITKEAAKVGLPAVLHLMAILNLSLAIFNLLPFPVLDGGHLFFLFLERIRKKRISPKAEDWINRLAIGVLVMLVIFVFINDLTRFVIK